MARRNGSTTIANWNANTADAPYRASVNADAAWDCSLPHYDYAAAMRVSPGGRLLLAFQHEGIRDSFVAAHREQNGAQVEPDGATHATRRQPVKPTYLPKGIDESFARYEEARLAAKAAEQALENAYVPAINCRIDSGDIDGALPLVQALPTDTVMRTVAISRLIKSGKWNSDLKPLWNVERAPHTTESARLLATFMETKLTKDIAESHMGEFLAPLVDDFVARKDRAGLAALIERTPPHVGRAFMQDALDYRIKDAA